MPPPTTANQESTHEPSQLDQQNTVEPPGLISRISASVKARVHSVSDIFSKPSAWLIIPPMLIHVAGASLGGAPMNQFMILAVCQRKPAPPTLHSYSTGFTHSQSNSTITAWRFSKKFEVSDNLPTYGECVARSDVQERAALFNQLFSLAYDIPSFILIPLMGRLVDTLGRKTMMALPIAASVLHALSVIIIASTGISLYFLVAVKFVAGFMGGYTLLMMAVYAFIADTTSVGERTQTFLTLDTCVFISFMFGPITGGIIDRNFGLLTVFAIIAFLDLLVLAYTIFLLPETLHLGAQTIHQPIPELSSTEGARDPERVNMWSNFLQSWSGCLDILSTPGRGTSLLILGLMTAVNGLGSAGYSYLFYFYPSQKFGWDAYDFGVYAMVKSLCRMFYLSIVLPLLLRTFVLGQETIKKTRAELTIIRVGYLLYAVGLICHAFATEGWMFFPLVFIYTSGTIAGPTIRGIVSRAVAPTSQGKLFAALELLQGGTSLFSNLVVPGVYRLLVGIRKPHYMFFVQASFWTVSLGLTMYLKSRELVGIEQQHVAEIQSDNDDVMEPLIQPAAPNIMTPDEESNAFSNSSSSVSEVSFNPGRLPTSIRSRIALMTASNQSLRDSFVRGANTPSLREYTGNDGDDSEVSLNTRETQGVARVGAWLLDLVDAELVEYGVDETSREMSL
ncbi:hypothetical protein HDU78_004531 [Chytriomyces hyalinus]|nr:hypothetical protein HDU78_004531 [Chytriomyces hyalinus]